MTKLFASLRTALLAAVSVTALASCELYFGESDDDGGGGGTAGLPCNSDADCAAGCYCELPPAGGSAEQSSGTCVEAGFCSTDADCPPDHHCDDRSSCVPNTCGSDADCDTGFVCENSTCTATCTCTSDSEAIEKLGTTEAYCDESRETCHNGLDPAGYCATQLTCNEVMPSCPEVGTTPLIGLDGCWTGECKAIAQCEAAPVCENLQHLEDCQARSTGGAPDCQIVATGTNCTKPGGGICNPGDTDCTCQNFQFHSCDTRASSNPPVPEN